MIAPSTIDQLDPLPPLGNFLANLLALEPEDGNIRMTAITVSMPVEFDILAGGGQVLALGASPPTQAIETSVLPVFHQLRVTLVADGSDDEVVNDVRSSDGSDG